LTSSSYRIFLSNGARAKCTCPAGYIKVKIDGKNYCSGGCEKCQTASCGYCSNWYHGWKCKCDDIVEEAPAYGRCRGVYVGKDCCTNSECFKWRDNRCIFLPDDGKWEKCCEDYGNLCLMDDGSTVPVGKCGRRDSATCGTVGHNCLNIGCLDGASCCPLKGTEGNQDITRCFETCPLCWPKGSVLGDNGLYCLLNVTD